MHGLLLHRRVWFPSFVDSLFALSVRLAMHVFIYLYIYIYILTCYASTAYYGLYDIVAGASLNLLLG